MAHRPEEDDLGHRDRENIGEVAKRAVETAKGKGREKGIQDRRDGIGHDQQGKS